MLSNQLQNKIKKNFWSHEILEAVPFYIFQPAESEAYINKYYPVYFSLVIGFISFGNVSWHYIEKEQEEIAQYLVDKIKRNKNYSLLLLNRWLKDSKNFYRLYNQMMRGDFGVYTDKELGSDFNTLYNCFLPLGARSFVLEGFSFKADVVLEKMLRETVKHNNREDLYEQALIVLSSTTHESFLQEAEQKLYSLYKKYSDNLPEKVLNRYLSDYAWVHNNYAGTGSLDRKWVLEQIKEFKYKALQKLNKAKIISERNSIFKKIKASSDLMNFSRAIDDFMFWQDQRKKMVFHVIEVQKKLLVEFSKRWKIEKNLLEYLSPAEFVSWARHGKMIDRKKLLSRQKNCCIMVAKNNISLIDKDVVKIKKLITTKYSRIENRQELKGSVANLGKVSGRVKIVLKVKDMENFKSGDILISSMTRPDMTPALKKAAAVVTDDGGITCHAAIISRELNIPCIVGTKVATRVFKDGDLVEVDANHGIIKTIE